jgi:hypothetical protein
MVAWGTQEQIQYYCSLYDKINDYILNENVLIHPETLLAYHLKDKKIKRVDCKVYLRNELIL